MPAGVLLRLGLDARRSGAARRVGAGGSAAGSCLLGHGDGARATVLARLPATATTTGTLDHAGGAVRHRAGPPRDDRGPCALTARNDRRHRRGGPDRTSVAGPDTTRTGNVRGPGETAGLRLVGVGALVRVPTATFLAAGQALATTDHALGAGVPAGLHKAVRAGVGPGLAESARAGVGARLHETVRTRVGPGLVETAWTGVCSGLVQPARTGVCSGLVHPARAGVGAGLVHPAWAGVGAGLVHPARTGVGRRPHKAVRTRRGAGLHESV
ncbi:hypothetical protein SAMN05421541_10557 [Actinoplanes philippinensis]|uniref:Uncharacterized protein n=1 Tax=Actinoplanes philippinensis TaxID=35752 RepID=A0A1I2F3Q2_9ACTN|nr:hypothetical protein SAMN05421541_10557 [Actinoplanes philippinensis]